MRSGRRAILAGACLAAGIVQDAWSEDWPTRAIRMWVPFTPGGPMDIFGRPLAEKLGERLGQTVVVENKPGANGIVAPPQAATGKPRGNGIVATHQLATAKPDGYTLLFTTGSFIGNLAFSQQPLPYDPMKDVA